MRKSKYWGILLAGLGAGTVNGLFGAGGGMVLIPLLTWLTDVNEDSIFPTSVSMILPMCIAALTVTAITGTIPWEVSLPYLLGAAAGGLASGIWGKAIPVKWLHRGLGIMILWGGFRYLC